MSATEQTGLRLYDYPPSPNCYKVRLLLSELGIEHERVVVDIFGGDTLTGEYARRNPALATPVLELPNGDHLPESGAILLYLAEGTPFMPDGQELRAQVHRWMFFEQGSVYPQIGALRFRLLTGRLDPGSEEAKRSTAIAQAIVAVVNQHLSEHEFVVDGRYSVADIALYGYLHVADEAGVQIENNEHLARWLEEVRSQPGHLADLAPYPANARRGAGKSIYDAVGL
jgi:glutathione S-transferase